VQVGDLVRYDPRLFQCPPLKERQSLPGGYVWSNVDYGTEGEKDWVGVIVDIDENMWRGFGGTGYEIYWNHGYREKVYAFEVVKVLDKDL
tara:strand:- start:3152 stop:3421 length:270 start_codon:yes stop_codon:yes gene_type:complete